MTYRAAIAAKDIERFIALWQWTSFISPLQMTFKCTIIFDNFFHALLQLTTIVCTFSIDNVCIDYYNRGLLYTAKRHKNISYIDCNSTHKLIAAL